MDWKTFIANLMDSLAWPAALIAVVLLVRKSVLPLLSTLRQVRYGDLQVNFGEEVAAIKDATNDEEDYSQLLVTEAIVQLADVSPRAAIIDTWIEVEKSVLAAAERTGVVVNKFSQALRSPAQAMRLLLEARKIDEGTFNMFNNLRVLRNEAVHARDSAISKTEAINTSDMCLRLKARLDDA